MKGQLIGNLCYKKKPRTKYEIIYTAQKKTVPVCSVRTENRAEVVKAVSERKPESISSLFEPATFLL